MKTSLPIRAALGLLLMSSFCVSKSEAQVFKTQEQALHETFAGADTIVRRTLFLDEAQVEALQKKSMAKFSSRVISYYLGYKGKTLQGIAFFEKQIVRTKETVVMIVIGPKGAVQKVDVLAFMEPRDYLPIPKWFTLFEGKALTADLWPGRRIDAVTGATLSVRAFTQAVRRSLALFELITEAKP